MIEKTVKFKTKLKFKRLNSLNDNTYKLIKITNLRAKTSNLNIYQIIKIF